MSSIYDKLKRRVEATLKRKQVCDIALCESLISSGASDFGSDSFREDVAGNSGNDGVKVTKKDSFEDGSGARSNSHVNIVSSGRSNSWNVIAWKSRILEVVKSGWRMKNKLNSTDSKKKFETPKEPTVHIAARTFTLSELAAATRNFRPECLLGEDEVGRVFKGQLKSTGQVVAVKHLDSYGDQTNQEYSVEVLVHCPLHHPNIVNLIGYCADGNHRLLVYEYTTLGSLKDNLHDLPSDKEPLDWNTRMKIAAGVAKALEYLHDKANPPFVHRDLKPSNILLDEGYFPKLSNFRLAKLGSVSNKNSVSTSVKGTYGYCAPEYGMIGLLTSKADVYSFGVVFLELITGRKAIDNTRGKHINLVTWARPLFNDRRNFSKIVDPLLQGRYPMRGLYQALAVACMCLQEKPAARPPIRDVVTAVTYLASQTYDPNAPPTHSKKAGPSTQKK